MNTYEDPRYVVLDSVTGNGSVFFRGTKVTVELVIEKLVIEAGSTGSGVVAVIHRGQVKTSRSIALTMEANGALAHRCGEETEVRFTGGPRGATMKVTAHVEEKPL